MTYIYYSKGKKYMEQMARFALNFHDRDSFPAIRRSSL